MQVSSLKEESDKVCVNEQFTTESNLGLSSQGGHLRNFENVPQNYSTQDGEAGVWIP